MVRAPFSPGSVMPSKFEEFLSAKKIDPRQLLIASKDLEGLQPEDRAIKLAKRRGRAEGASEADKNEKRKPRSVGSRPAEVCGCVNRPRASSSASTERIEAGDRLIVPARLFEPTGCPRSR